MIDFSKTLLYASTLAYIMRDGKEKTPLKMWEDACLLLLEEETKYAAIVNKELKSAQNKLAKIERLRAEIKELEGQKDEEILSESCKTHLTRIYAWEKYKKWVIPAGAPQNWVNKGQLVEDKSVELLSGLDGRAYCKNTQRYSNHLITGIPDIVVKDDAGQPIYVIDVKSSWDIISFFSNLDKELTANYWWQIQGYLFLTGAPRGEISYCLNSTPEHLIKEEIALKNLVDKYPSEEWVVNNYSYDDIPAAERRIQFVIERDDEAIAKIEKRVLKAREYLAYLEQMHTTPRLAKGDL